MATETAFGVPGLGSYLVAALNARDWSLFDENMSELDPVRPQADDLYLLGREQLDRYANHGRAVRFFRAALERDPAYVPAQLQLVRVPRA